MYKKLIVVTVLMAILSSISNAQNPIIQTIYTADPAPMVYKDTVYLYADHDEDGSTYYTMNDWRCYSSTDMVNWTDHGVMMSYKTFSWAKGDAWAGQCVYRNGKFYYYVPITSTALGRSAIGVGVSDSPTGPFTDALGHPLISDEWGDIDPTVFIDDDGQAYLYWGNPNLYYVKLNDDMISYNKTVGIVKVPLNAEGFGQRTGDADRATLYEEGPWFYKRNGLYYLLFSAGGIPEYISYSTSTSSTGPWTYKGVIMSSQGGSFTNHCGVIDYKGNSYFFYHNGALAGGGGFTRSIAIEQFAYKTDGSFPAINMTTAGVASVGKLNPFIRNEAEMIAWESGVETKTGSDIGVYVTDIDNGDYIKVKNVDFGASGAGVFTANVASALVGGTIELHLDKLDGLSIGTLLVSYTGGWDKWKTETTNISGATGTHDLYLVFKGDAKAKLLNVDFWQFGEMSASHDLVAINASVDKYKIDTITGFNSANMKVTAIYADGTNEDVTLLADAIPDKDGLVIIKNGTITGTGYGSININVSYKGKTEVQSFVVKDLVGELTVKELTLDTSKVSLLKGSTHSLVITAKYVDGHTVDVTQNATYTNPHPEIAGITKGVITAKIIGSTKVTVSFKGEKGATVTTVIDINVINRDPYIQNEAEEMSEQSGVQTETCSDAGGGNDVGFIENGDWIRINGLDFGAGASSFNARVSSAGNGGKIEVRLDSPTGTLAGTCTAAATGSWQTWITKSCPVSGISGIHDIYLKFTGGSGYLFNLNWWKFIASPTSSNTIADKTPISIIFLDHKKYLKGTRAGDLVTIYNSLGQKISTFKANTDLEPINSNQRVAIIEVLSGGQRYIIKTVF
jgi:hypothetical protein